MLYTVTEVTPTQLPQCIREVTAEWPLSIGVRSRFLSLGKCCTGGHKMFIFNVAHSKEHHSKHTNLS